MGRMREDPKRVVIMGLGRGGSGLLDILLEEPSVTIVAAVENDPNALGLHRAREYGIRIYSDVKEALLASAPCVAFNLTGNEMVDEVASEILGAGSTIGGMEAKLIWNIINDLRKTKQELEYQATHDVLTGLYNRRYMVDQLQREITHTMRYGHSFSIVLLDLDHFKDVNDTFGHDVGDIVLRQVAADLMRFVRASDIVGRWGGEEFVVLLPHCSEKEAEYVANSWIERVRFGAFAPTNGKVKEVTFSAGISTIHGQEGENNTKLLLDRMLSEADERLYEAKEAGRARVVGAPV